MKRTRGRPGRPAALTTELKAEICDRVVLGETVRQIAADPRMPAESTIFLTLARDAEFAAEYGRARVIQCYRWEDEIIEIADGTAGDWVTREGHNGTSVKVANQEHIQRSRIRIDARKWLMSKRVPKRYGEKVTQEHVGSEGGPIQTRELSPLERARRARFHPREG